MEWDFDGWFPESKSSLTYLLLADTAISPPRKSRLTYNRLVVGTATSNPVMAYSSSRPKAVATGNYSLASEAGLSRVLSPILSSSAYLADNGMGQV